MKIPISGISPLSKTLLQIRGPDATRFLNGLITSRLLPNVIKKKQHTISEHENKHAILGEIINLDKNWGLMHEDIYDPDQNILIRRDGLNSMFLNSKGRVVNDCFLYSQPFHNINNFFEKDIEEPNFLVEIDNAFTNQLQMLLRLHKLSARIKVEPKKQFHSYYYYNDSVEFDEWLDDIQYNYFSTLHPDDALQNANSFIEKEIIFNSKFSKNIVGFAIDNRIPNFGFKFITNHEITINKTSEDDEKILLNELFSEDFMSKFPINITSEDFITRRRFLNGLFEVNDAPKGTSLLPFETNLDYVNGLSLDKGCYVGQELTIRTFNNGIIRKRIFPIQFFTINADNINAIKQQDQIILDPHESIMNDIKNLDSSSILKLDVASFEDSTLEVPTQQVHNPFASSSSETTPNNVKVKLDTNSPFKSSPSSSSASPFESSKPIRKRKTSKGKILSILDNLGFMIMNLADFEKTDLYQVEIPSLETEDGVKKIGIKVFHPDWWPEEDSD